jgi:hypothetical protein
MPTYYRWIARGLDLGAAQKRTLQVSASPRHAYWVFNMGGGYMPSGGVHGERTLVAITFTAGGEAILMDQSRWVRFPGSAFKGEAQHPDQIIVKSNEPGAFGIGASLLGQLNRLIKDVRLANREELAKALGRAVPQSQVDARMKGQKW